MMIHLAGEYHDGSRISLDLREQFGERVELEMFEFSEPPIQFRLLQDGSPLLKWQSGNTEFWHLAHPARGTWWQQGNSEFSGYKPHRSDVATCGVLSRGVELECGVLCGRYLLFVWLREGTYPTKGSCSDSMQLETAEAAS